MGKQNILEGWNDWLSTHTDPIGEAREILAERGPAKSEVRAIFETLSEGQRMHMANLLNKEGYVASKQKSALALLRGD
jgi:hypothetical protein